jgi:hypothetical protein
MVQLLWCCLDVLTMVSTDSITGHHASCVIRAIARGANGSGQRHDVVAGGHGELIGAIHTDGVGHPVEHLVR